MANVPLASGGIFDTNSVSASIGTSVPVKKKTYGVKSDFGILEDDAPKKPNNEILSGRTNIP